MRSRKKTIIPANRVDTNGSEKSPDRGEEHLLLSTSGLMLEPRFTEMKGNGMEYPVSGSASQEIGSTCAFPGIQGTTPLPIYADSHISIDIPVRYGDMIVTGITTDNCRMQWVQNTSGAGRPTTIANNASILTAWIV